MKNGKDIRKILFVCLGNICRSPAAEGVMKKMLCDVDAEEDFIIGSAGIGGMARRRAARHTHAQVRSLPRILFQQPCTADMP